MSKDVSVEWRGDEVIITKLANTREADETVEALKRAVEFFNKNDDSYTSGANGDHEDAEDRDDDEHDERDEEEAELTPRQRRAAEKRRLLAALARLGIPPPGTT